MMFLLGLLPTRSGWKRGDQKTELDRLDRQYELSAPCDSCIAINLGYVKQIYIDENVTGV